MGTNRKAMIITIITKSKINTTTNMVVEMIMINMGSSNNRIIEGMTNMGMISMEMISMEQGISKKSKEAMGIIREEIIMGLRIIMDRIINSKTISKMTTTTKEITTNPITKMTTITTPTTINNKEITIRKQVSETFTMTTTTKITTDIRRTSTTKITTDIRRTSDLKYEFYIFHKI